MLYIAALPCQDDQHKTAWSLLENMLSAALPNFDKNSIMRTESGKPYLKGNEAFFSLSHTDGAVCAAVCISGEADIKTSLPEGAVLFSEKSGKLPVGVDIEGNTARDFHKIARGFFTEKEKEYLAAEEDTSAAFYYVYTRKESLVKASGRGIGELRDLGSSLELDGVYTYNISFAQKSFTVSVATKEEHF